MRFSIELQPQHLARLLLVLGVVACIVAAVGPFQALEFKLFPWDKAAHVVALYAITALLFLGFPKRRRLDLALMAALGGCSIEVLQYMAGRDAELGDMVANAVGAFAVLVPGYLEQARTVMRDGERRERRSGPLARARANAGVALQPRARPTEG